MKEEKRGATGSETGNKLIPLQWVQWVVCECSIVVYVV